MSALARLRRARVAALVLALALALPPAMRVACAADGPALAALAGQVLARGASAGLPAGLARALGLSGKGGGPLGMRQAVVRQGGDVHVYGVVEAGGNAIVLLHMLAAGTRTEAFLLGGDGQLARALAYTGAGEVEELPAAEAAPAFAREAALWLARSSSAPAARAPGR